MLISLTFKREVLENLHCSRDETFFGDEETIAILDAAIAFAIEDLEKPNKPDLICKKSQT